MAYTCSRYYYYDSGGAPSGGFEREREREMWQGCDNTHSYMACSFSIQLLMTKILSRHGSNMKGSILTFSKGGSSSLLLFLCPVDIGLGVERTYTSFMSVPSRD